MKKLLSVTLVLVMSVAFTSCQKNGVFNPKNKISKVFQQPENGSKALIEEWTWWNDGNTLTSVAYFINDTTVQKKAYYYYEKKQLVRIENTLDLSYVKITYNGDSQYDKIETYDKFDRKLRSYAYTYDGKKVSKIELTAYKNPSKSMEIDDVCFLSVFIPKEILEETNAQLMNPSPLKADGDIFISYALKFDGDNMSEWKAINNNDPNKLMEMTYSYESYDKNLNPYYASYPNVDDMNAPAFCFYKNNPEKVTRSMVMNGGVPEIITFDYTYKYNDKKFPTEAICTQMKDGIKQALITTYYEYK